MSGSVVRAICLTVVLVAAPLWTTSEAFAQQSCDRACLRTMLDGYLDAVIANDPSAAPLVVGFRQTENALNVRPGKGVWQTVTGLGEVQRRYFDPTTGQAGYYGTVEEGDSTAVVTVRVRVENRELTEAEWYITRADDPGMNGPRQPGGPPANRFNPQYLAENPPPERVVPVDQRVDRAALVRIVESYFDAITSHDGSVALTHPGCGRVENGSPTPPGRFLPPLPRTEASGGQSGPAPNPSNDCVSNLENFNAQMVVARRIPLVDEEAQVALAFGVFIRRPGSPTPRLAFSEWFIIDAALIRTVYTAMFYPPPELAVPNWPPYDGNWPLPASIVPEPAQGRP